MNSRERPDFKGAESWRELDLDGSNLAVAGDSVGGSPAIVQVLFYPVTNANLSDGSYNEFADRHGRPSPVMEWFWNAYAPNDVDRYGGAVRMGPSLVGLSLGHHLATQQQ